MEKEQKDNLKSLQDQASQIIGDRGEALRKGFQDIEQRNKDKFTALEKQLKEEIKKRKGDKGDKGDPGVLIPQDIREIRGEEGKLDQMLNTLKVDKMDVDDDYAKDYIDGEIQAVEDWGDEYKNKANDPNSIELQKKSYETFERFCRKEADRIRLAFRRKPIHNEALDTIQEEVDNNPLVGLEKFKKYIRENWRDIAVIG